MQPIGAGFGFYRIVRWFLISILIYSSSSKAIIRYLPDVVYHAVQEPLDVHLDLAPQGEPVKAFMSTDVCEHRLYYGHPQWVDPATLFTLNFFYHELGEVHAIWSNGDIQGLWTTVIAVYAFPLYLTIHAVMFLGTIYTI